MIIIEIMLFKHTYLDKYCTIGHFDIFIQIIHTTLPRPYSNNIYHTLLHYVLVQSLESPL